MSDLINTTQMYLRTILELEEVGVVVLRARLAQRLSQSGPTVSETVARMQRDGLVTLKKSRIVSLTPQGRAQAVEVMRKHRLIECLLTQVMGVDLMDAHEEACKLEHVFSEQLEQKTLELTGFPTHSPYGCRIPGLEVLGVDAQKSGTLSHLGSEPVELPAQGLDEAVASLNLDSSTRGTRSSSGDAHAGESGAQIVAGGAELLSSRGEPGRGDTDSQRGSQDAKISDQKSGDSSAHRTHEKPLRVLEIAEGGQHPELMSRYEQAGILPGADLDVSWVDQSGPDSEKRWLVRGLRSESPVMFTSDEANQVRVIRPA